MRGAGEGHFKIKRPRGGSVSLRAGLCPLSASRLPSGLREGGANAFLSSRTRCASHSEQMRALLQRGFAPVLPGTSRGLGGGGRTGEGVYPELSPAASSSFWNLPLSSPRRHGGQVLFPSCRP